MFARLLQCPDVHEHVVLRSAVGFLALHGGIEPGTERMALAAADAADASAYVVTQPRALGWHVSSHRIVAARVPRLAAFLDHVDIVVSVHGYLQPAEPDAVFVGGAQRVLAHDLARRLRAVIDEMPVVDDLDGIPRRMRGIDPRNPVNGSRGGGVQLELPHRARDRATTASRGGSPIAERVVAALTAFASARAA